MVKGVNKTVIEVNDTGSKMFEKIVFYVSPQYGNISAKRLKKAAGDLARELDVAPQRPLRARVIRKRRQQALLIGGVLLLAIGVVLFIVL